MILILLLLAEGQAVVATGLNSCDWTCLITASLKELNLLGMISLFVRIGMGTLTLVELACLDVGLAPSPKDTGIPL